MSNLNTIAQPTTGNQSAREIVAYYDACEWDYKIAWNLDTAHAMHYGFWCDGVRSLAEAQLYQNLWLAQAVQINASDRVLDAGCGIGGSALYLAAKFHCNVLGISLSEKQVQRARMLASQKELARAEFAVRDFCATDLAAQSFDVVWAIESVCHARHKAAFIAEAFRLLKPGGRLVIADGFSKSNMSEMNTKDLQLMRGWLEPWAVDSLTTADQFINMLSNNGFIQLDQHDVTKWIQPSARKLYRRSVLATLPSNLLYRAGLRNRIQHSNVIAGRTQWHALARNLWEYRVLTARKPD